MKLKGMVVAIIAAIAMFALTASASAHTDFTSVNLSGSTSTFVSGQSFTTLSCWQQLNISPGQTKYVINGNWPAGNRYGIGNFDNWHIHPVQDDYTTGTETRMFTFTNWPNNELHARKVQIDTGGFGYLPGVKFVHVGTSGYVDSPVIVRANC